MKSAARRARAEQVRGQRAWLVSRLAAGAIDLVVVAILLFAVLVVVALVRYMLGDGAFHLPHAGPRFTAIAYPVTEIVYLTVTWAGRGRSAGKEIVGLRVVGSDGRPLGHLRAFGRAVFVTFLAGPSLLWVAVSRRNAAVHDIVLKTAVVYDWSDAVHAPPAPQLDGAT
jgi:uncharacterized RDD family membrane protein YckC